MKYRRFTILEIVYFNEGVSINTDVEEYLLKQLKACHEVLLCVSLVVNGNILEYEGLSKFIRYLKELRIAISLSFYNCDDFEGIKSIKKDVNQIRISIDEDMDNPNELLDLFEQIKTPSNNVIFLFEINHINKLNAFAKLLDSNDFIYNISYSSNLNYDLYWDLAKYVSELKKQYPLKIFQEFTCAGIMFDNIKGVCPAKLSLMCVDTRGNIGFCRKDTFNHDLNIFEGNVLLLFDRLEERIQQCSKLLCDEREYKECFCGCPLDMEYSTNKYCKYILEKEV